MTFLSKTLAIAALLLNAVSASPQTQPASAPAPTSAKITGTIVSTTPITRIAAVDRPWADTLKISQSDPQNEYLYPGQCDPKTGVFVIDNLLPGRTYDLIVWNQAGRWEGVNLAFHRPILRAAEAITDEDKLWLKEFIEKTPQFYDRSRILWMAGDHKHATLLVELVRTRDFHSGKAGEVIFRTELWYFENLFGGWAKDKNTERVISRWRGPGKDAPAVWQYVPQLGGITIPAAGPTPPLHVTLPEKPDKKRGLAGSLETISTQPSR